MENMKEVSSKILVILFVIAVIFSVASASVIWSGTQASSQTPESGLSTEPTSTVGMVSVNVVPKETAPEEGGENG